MKRLLAVAFVASFFGFDGSARAEQWPVSEVRLRLLSESSEADRIQAASLLPNAGKAARAVALARLLSDSSTEVRLRTIEAVLRDPSPETAILVAPLVLDGERNVADRALHFLRLAGSAETAPWLEQLLLGSDAELEAGALEVLGTLSEGPGSQLEAVFIGKLKDPEPTVRRAASRALAFGGEERALPSLALLLRDPDVGVQAEAARALAAIGGKVAFSFLRVVVLESSPAERRALLPAFVEMPESHSEPQLIPFVVDRFLNHPGATDGEIFRLISRVTESPWILRALELAQNPAQRPAVALLFDGLGGGASKPSEAFFRERTLRCLEQEAGPLCHQIATDLLDDADERRIEAYRAGRLRADEIFRGVDFAHHQALSFLAFEMLEDSAANVRSAALIALSTSSLSPNDGAEPLADLLERKEPSREERAVILSLLGRSSSRRARELIELYERSSVPAIQHAAEDARLGQLFLEQAPACSDVLARASAVQRRSDSFWSRGRSAPVSLAAFGCLLRSLQGGRTAERVWIERLLAEVRIKTDGVTANETFQGLSDEAFSLAVRAAEEERALLLQIALTLGFPSEARSELMRSRLDAETNRQIAMSFWTHDHTSRTSPAPAQTDRALRALALSAAPTSSAEFRERLRTLEEPGSLPALGARLGLFRAAIDKAIPGRKTVIERACRDVRVPSETVRVESIVLLGALGPEGVPDVCWRAATVGAYSSSESRIRLAALIAATRSRENPLSARVLRLCHLYEKDPTALRGCEPAPLQSSEADVDRRLISRRLSGRASGSLAFLAFVMSEGELGVEMGITDRSGRFLARADREYLEFVAFE